MGNWENSDQIVEISPDPIKPTFFLAPFLGNVPDPGNPRKRHQLTPSSRKMRAAGGKFRIYTV